ncbi:MAG: hypothetical protein ACYDEA_04245, partial [Candidatus Dormibacteria bacterium]
VLAMDAGAVIPVAAVQLQRVEVHIATIGHSARDRPDRRGLGLDRGSRSLPFGRDRSGVGAACARTAPPMG